MSGVEPRYAALADHASKHHGLFTGAEADRLGVSLRQVRTLVGAGWCERVAQGVYRVAAAPPSGRQMILAEVLAHPDGTVAGHRAAAHVWGLVGYHVPRPEVLIELGGNQRRSGRVRTTRWLPKKHVTSKDAIPITRVARTIFDLAGIEPVGRVEVALDDALARNLCNLRQINQVFFALARRGRRGTVAMRELLEARGEGYVPPASELERMARKVFADHGVPVPRFEVSLGGDDLVGRVDCTWPHARLVVELDGHRWHGSRSARERDRRRDNELTALGWRIIRVTWDDLRDRPAETAAQILAALAAAA